MEETEKDRAQKGLWKEYAQDGPREGYRWTDPIQFANILNFVFRWLDTRDPVFMDYAVLYCQDHGFPVQPTLLKYVSDAILQRLEKKTTTRSRPAREGIKEKAFRIITNLRACDVSLGRASQVAAVWTVDHTPHPLKASTLEREYSKEPYFKKLESDMRRVHGESPGTREAWLKREAECRDITSDEAGERR